MLWQNLSGCKAVLRSEAGGYGGRPVEPVVIECPRVQDRLADPNVIPPEKLVLGVDVGGTKIAAGLVDRTGRIFARRRLPMISDRDAGTGLRAVLEAIQATLADPEALGQEIAAIGISSPGPVDRKTGVVANPPNLPCWRDFPLVTEIERTMQLPTRLENDANAAALAEAVWGAGRGYASVFYVTLGTGVGTGIVLGGKLYAGRTGTAGEGGHVSIDYRGERCRCGKRGCVEAYIAGPALAGRVQQRLAEGHGASKILGLAGGKLAAVTPITVEQAYQAGDALAEELLRETADYFTIWLGNIIDLLEPDIVVVGGGMARVMARWFDYVRSRLPKWCVNPHGSEVPLRLAEYGEYGGIAGAAALWYEATG